MSSSMQMGNEFKFDSSLQMNATNDLSRPCTFVTSHTLSGYRPEDFAGIELSLVAEVERVFVWSEDDMYRVVAVINDDDETVAEKVYARELCIVEALPQCKFDFYVLPRMGRDLSELVEYAAKPAYSRR